MFRIMLKKTHLVPKYLYYLRQTNLIQKNVYVNLLFCANCLLTLENMSSFQKQDPTQFVRVYGRPCKIHLDMSVALAAEGPQTMQVSRQSRKISCLSRQYRGGGWGGLCFIVFKLTMSGGLDDGFISEIIQHRKVHTQRQ